MPPDMSDKEKERELNAAWSGLLSVAPGESESERLRSILMHTVRSLAPAGARIESVDLRIAIQGEGGLGAAVMQLSGRLSRDHEAPSARVSEREILTATDLDVMARANCGAPGCDGQHVAAFLEPRCHHGAGAVVSYVRGTRILDLRCVACGSWIAEVLVAGPAADLQ